MVVKAVMMVLVDVIVDVAYVACVVLDVGTSTVVLVVVVVDCCVYFWCRCV